MIKRALISVSDKSGIVEFSRSLTKLNIDIISTSGTAKLLKKQGIKTTEVADWSGFPEIMSGRLKTLHPRIQGGILARRGIDEAEMVANNITAIDLVVINLYPFIKTISQPNCTIEEVIENIDIGGPTMLRAAAKNHQFVTVIVNKDDYSQIMTEINKRGNTTLKTRQKLALKAFEHSANYDDAIANYLGRGEQDFPHTLNLQFTYKKKLRYGENSHQNAALYVENNPKQTCIATSKQLQGKDLSFNNIADADAALECLLQFDKPACVIVKHANPCGVALKDNIYQAYLSAYKTDPTSAFGGIIAVNKILNFKTLKTIIDKQFVEVVIAPAIDGDAKKLLTSKPNVRLLIYQQLTSNQKQLDYKRIRGGLLVQDKDSITISADDLRCVSKIKPRDKQLADLLFAYKVAKFVKSNAIVYAKHQTTIGIGAGQMSRIDSAKIATLKAINAGLKITGAVMASDAFFPFKDSIDVAAKTGIEAIIQPGGSVRDNEVIDTANKAGIVMIFTGIRHFKH